ncbi:uncharacterized protein LOC117325750 [Pecten maximus]|uniref:uncharacterized protein LOC117325750 n=1 Tax=Pecten maximus TaxID=6579 RepID=UPI0014588C38|nr:uncharacterized protein LOC117325750 [Pecten maximus]
MDLRLELESLLLKLTQDDVSDSQRNNLIGSSQQEINIVLKKLLHHLENQHDVEKSLTELPDIGQVLGRLCGNRAVQGNKLLYHSTMMCVLSLYRVEPLSQLEQKAKDWALAQLQNTLKKKPKDTYHTCGVGISHTKIMQRHISKLSAKVFPALKECIGDVRVRCVGSGTHIPGEVYTEVRATIQQIVGVLLSVPQSDEYQDVWTDILWILSVHGLEEPWVQDIYQKITLHQNSSHMQGRSGGFSLSKSGWRLLWQSYLPSLEVAVLHHIDQACRVRLPSSVKCILKKQCFVEICAEDPVLLTVVSQMLQELIRHAGYNSELIWVTAVFYQLLQEHYSLAGSHDVTLLQLYPEHQNVVSAALSMFQPCTDVDVSADKVCKIVASLEDQQQNIGRQVISHNSMLYHRHWYLNTIRICLCCHKKFLDGCSSLLCWILEPKNIETQREIKIILHNCIQALRSLMTKVSLEVTDVLYVIQTEHSLSNVAKSAISHLVMMFLYKASAGMNIFKDVLPKVSLAKTPLDVLVYILTAHEELDLRFTDWSLCRLKDYCGIIQEFLHQASCDNLDTIPKEIFMATNSFLQKYNT